MRRCLGRVGLLEWVRVARGVYYDGGVGNVSKMVRGLRVRGLRGGGGAVVKLVSCKNDS